MKPYVNRIRRMLIFASVVMVTLASSATVSFGYASVAQAAAPSAASCAQASAAVGAGAPKQAALTAVEPAVPPAGCPNGLIGYWKLDETSGKTFVDSSNNGLDAICTTHCPTPTTGKVHGAQSFDLTTVVTASTNITYDFGLTQSFSIEFWMKTAPGSTCAGNQVAVARATAILPSDHQWWVGCEEGGTAEFLVESQHGDAAIVRNTTVLTDTNWHYVAAVRDAGTNELRLYVDGTPQAPTATAFTQGFAFGTPVDIGWAKFGSPYHFVGDLDEVAIYNRVLTPAEVTDHHNRGLLGQGICDVINNLTPRAYLPLIIR